jgi:hypothetical protein
VDSIGEYLSDALCQVLADLLSKNLPKSIREIFSCRIRTKDMNRKGFLSIL